MSAKIEARIVVLEARIAKDTADLAELRLQLQAAGLVSEVAAGYTVSFKVGRAETRREVSGEVLGRGLVKDVDSVRVTVGTGLEAELFTIPVSQLTSIAAKASEPSEAAVALGTAAAGVSEADELLNSLNG